VIGPPFLEPEITSIRACQFSPFSPDGLKPPLFFFHQLPPTGWRPSLFNFILGDHQGVPQPARGLVTLGRPPPGISPLVPDDMLTFFWVTPLGRPSSRVFSPLPFTGLSASLRTRSSLGTRLPHEVPKRRRFCFCSTFFPDG